MTDPFITAKSDQLQSLFKDRVTSTKPLLIRALMHHVASKTSVSDISDELDTILMALCLTVFNDVTEAVNK